MRRVVVVGGGFCGLNVVLQLQEALRERRRAELVLVDAGAQFVFTPLLGAVAAGTLPPHRAVTSLRDLVDATTVRVVHDRVDAIDFEQQTLTLAASDEPLHFDSLALTVGSVTKPAPGDAEAVHVLRSIEDAMTLRTALMAAPGEPRRVLIIGGGCVGVELAGTLAAARNSGRQPALDGLDITLVEGTSRLLSGMHESLSAEAYRAMVDLGVDVRLGHEVESIARGEVTLRPADGVLERTLGADLLVWCGGAAASPLPAQCGLEVTADGRAVVDPSLRVPDLGEVYVGGDAAWCEGAGSATQRVDIAVQHARVLAGNLLAGSVGRSRRDWVWQPTTEVVHLGGGRTAAYVKGMPLRGRLAAGVWHAQLALMAPSLGQRLAVAADAGAALLESASKWLAARRSGPRPALGSSDDLPPES